MPVLVKSFSSLAVTLLKKSFKNKPTNRPPINMQIKTKKSRTTVPTFGPPTASRKPLTAYENGNIG